MKNAQPLLRSDAFTGCSFWCLQHRSHGHRIEQVSCTPDLLLVAHVIEMAVALVRVLHLYFLAVQVSQLPNGSLVTTEGNLVRATVNRFHSHVLRTERVNSEVLLGGQNLLPVDVHQHIQPFSIFGGPEVTVEVPGVL